MARAKQTVIVSKAAASNLAVAMAMAKPHVDKFFTHKQTVSFYRFRQLPPELFVKGSFRTERVAPGVQIVWGELQAKETRDA